jgi:hypothetical protein
VSLTSTTGNAYPGFPQNWQLNGGLSGTVNVSPAMEWCGDLPAAHSGAADASCPGNPTAINQQLVNVGLMNGNSGSGATIVGVSSDLSFGSDNGIGEKFFADFHPIGANPDSSQMMPGWELQTNSFSLQGHWNCGTCTNSTPAKLVRSLTFGGDQNYTLQATMFVGANVLNCIGFNNASAGTFINPTAAGFIGTCFTASGWTIYNNGATLSTPPCGTTGSYYDVTLWYYQGHVRASCMPLFVNAGVTTPILDSITPPANITNFEVTSSSVDDRIEFARYSVGGGPGNATTNTINMPYSMDSMYNQNAIFTDSIAGTVWVLIPHNYKPGLTNRWVIYDHGFGEVGWNITGGGNAGVSNVAQSLVNAGYVVVGFNNVFQNCYGNPQCVTDTATVIRELTGAFSLAPQPYMFAESMGGLTMLNAITDGVVHPRAIVGVDVNTKLAWADSIGPSIIDAAYGVPYASTPAGYDPMLVTGQALTNLLVPTMLWSSPSDTTVLQGPNALAYAALINGILPGTVQLQAATGGHEDLSGFNGPAVANFFNSR